jgi:RNA polymerase sigma-54 factor
MKQSLQLRISQHLALTPQLQQSIRLLQLSTLELNQELEKILDENPMLERVDDPFSQALTLRNDGTLGGSELTPSDADTPITDTQNTTTENAESANSALESLDFSSDYGRPTGDEEDDSRPQLGGTPTSLRDYLLDQLRLEKLGLRERALVTLMIESLDDDGYLHTSDEELVELAQHTGLNEVRLEELTEAHALLRDLDPPGVGACNIADCLALQLADDSVLRHETAPLVWQCAQKICCTEGLQWLAQRDFAKLRQHTGASDATLRAAQALIKRLNPYPGAAFSQVSTHYVAPDVIVRRLKGEWVALLNPEVMPKLRVNELYAQALKTARAQNDSSAMLSNRLQEARWLIKNVQQRFDTILRVSQAIVERQRAFFNHGAVAMKPLVLREIAEVIGVHESTVSRVTTQKYMLTPFGTFELKYFFGSHVATETGGAASSTAIRALIKQLIGAEDPQKPLSDSCIADMLGEQGLVVARRTVAKYREALRLPPVNQRKVL